MQRASSETLFRRCPRCWKVGPNGKWELSIISNDLSIQSWLANISITRPAVAADDEFVYGCFATIFSWPILRSATGGRHSKDDRGDDLLLRSIQIEIFLHLVANSFWHFCTSFAMQIMFDFTTAIIVEPGKNMKRWVNIWNIWINIWNL